MNYIKSANRLHFPHLLLYKIISQFTYGRLHRKIYAKYKIRESEKDKRLDIKLAKLARISITDLVSDLKLKRAFSVACERPNAEIRLTYEDYFELKKRGFMFRTRDQIIDEDEPEKRESKSDKKETEVLKEETISADQERAINGESIVGLEGVREREGSQEKEQIRGHGNGNGNEHGDLNGNCKQKSLEFGDQFCDIGNYKLCLEKLELLQNAANIFEVMVSVWYSDNGYSILHDGELRNCQLLISYGLYYRRTLDLNDIEGCF